MNRKLIQNATLIMAMLLTPHSGRTQGTFVNLDFEHPIQPLNPTNSMVPIGNGLPGWTGYGGSTQLSSTDPIWYNSFSIGAAAISLEGPGSPTPILQGSYSVLLQGSTAGAAESVAIGQTGQIPTTSRSVQFYGADVINLQLTFNGQILPYSAVGPLPNGTMYGADISMYAGQSGQLLFTVPSNDEALIDNIQFSTSPVPEPASCALILCGTFLFGAARYARSKGKI